MHVAFLVLRKAMAMKKSTLRTIVYAVAGVGSLMFQQTSMAAEYTWTGGSLVTNKYWYDTANWSKTGGGTGSPDTAGDTVNLNLDFSTATTVRTTGGTLPIMKAGILNWGDSGAGTAVAVNIGNSNGDPAVTLNNNGNYNASTNTYGALINVGTIGTTVVTNNFRAHIVLEDNLTINTPATSTTTVASFNDWISESGGSWGVTKTGPGFITLNTIAAAPDFIAGSGPGNTYTGLTTLLAGRIVLSGTGNNCINGNIRINTTPISGVSQRLQSSGNERIVDTANIEFMTAISEWSMGGGSNETIGSLTSNSGMGFIQGGGTLTLSAASGSYSFGGQVGLSGQMIATLAKTGGSTQTLTGAATNTIGAVSVTGGILQLNKTPGTNINAIGNYNSSTLVDTAVPITLGDGAGHGTIRLLASNQISDVSTLTFNGGTLDMNGKSETLGTLTNGGNSTIDMGAGASVLTFANSSGKTWTGTIQILNWSGLSTGGGTDQLYFGNSLTGLTGTQVGMISFVNPAGYAPGTYGATILPTGEVVVPEPAIMGTLGLSSLLFLRRRRVRA